MKCLALVFVGLVGNAVAGLAQAPNSATWPPPAGVRVRVQSPALGTERQIGTVEGVTGDTLRFRRSDGVGPVSLGPAEITQIEVSGGTHTAKMKWAAIGFLVGAAAGAAIGSATYKQCKDSFKCIGDIGGRSGSIGFGALLGGLSGVAAGTLVGSPRRESWIPVRR